MATPVEVSADLLEYVRQVSLRDEELLAGLREQTARLPAGTATQVIAEAGQLLSLLVALTGARKVLEIGTFTGYSTLCMARSLPAGGMLVTCDNTGRWASIGKEYWKRAGVHDRIELRVADARATLRELRAEHGDGGFDLALIDADKANYPAYYEQSLALIRPGGLIVIDNTLFLGNVLHRRAEDPDAAAVHDLNTLLRYDDRIDLSLLPMADGITLARKR